MPPTLINAKTEQDIKVISGLQKLSSAIQAEGFKVSRHAPVEYDQFVVSLRHSHNQNVEKELKAVLTFYGVDGKVIYHNSLSAALPIGSTSEYHICLKTQQDVDKLKEAIILRAADIQQVSSIKR